MNESIVRVERLVKVGETNVNGRKFDWNSYRESLNSERFQMLLTNEFLYAEYGDPDPSEGINRCITIDLSNLAGVITKIEDDYIELDLINNDIKEDIDNGKLLASMRYLANEDIDEDGNSYITDINIITFDLVPRKDKD